MNTTQNQARRAPREVLYEFSLAATPPTADLLEAFVQRYPEHAEALTTFAVDIMVDTLHKERSDLNRESEMQIDAAVSRVMSRVLNRIYEVDKLKARTASPAIDNPLDKVGREELRQLEKHLHANAAFIMMLRDREIDVSTTTQGFRRTVAEALRVPTDVIYAHLAAPRRIPLGMRFMSNTKPEAVNKQSFAEAIGKCGLTEDQIAFLSKL